MEGPSAWVEKPASYDLIDDRVSIPVLRLICRSFFRLSSQLVGGNQTVLHFILTRDIQHHRTFLQIDRVFLDREDKVDIVHQGQRSTTQVQVKFRRCHLCGSSLAAWTAYCQIHPSLLSAIVSMLVHY
jgi:hypothetical protein